MWEFDPVTPQKPHYEKRAHQEVAKRRQEVYLPTDSPEVNDTRGRPTK